MTTASAEATNDNQKWLYRLVHLTIFSTTAYLTYLADPGSSLFSWHPFLMGLAVSTYFFYELTFQSLK